MTDENTNKPRLVWDARKHWAGYVASRVRNWNGMVAADEAKRAERAAKRRASKVVSITDGRRRPPR
jgi:hypothetical protein